MKSVLKSTLLILLITWSSKSFSQIDIDSVSIQLPNSLAKLIIKDLIEGDGAKQELSLTLDKISLLESKIKVKNDIIFNLNSKISNYSLLLNTKDNQLSLSQELSKKLERDLKKSRFKSKLYFGVGTIGIIVTALIVN